MGKNRSTLFWAFVSIAILIILVRVLKAQALSAYDQAAQHDQHIAAIAGGGFTPVQNQCSPAVVEWRRDSLEVVSFGCIDFRKDSLIIIPHLVNGAAVDKIVVQKPQVKAVTLLQPTQRATLRHEVSIPP